MMYTTLNKIRAHSPCQTGWNKLLKHLGKTQADDEPLSFATILESNGLDDALWCTRAAPEYDREWRLYAVWCARQVEHLLTNPRSKTAIDVAEKFANGQATEDELMAAGENAWVLELAEMAAAEDWGAAWLAVWSAHAAASAAAWMCSDEDNIVHAQCFLWVVNGGLAKFEGRE